MIRVWLPQNMGGIMIHVSSVCGDVFHRFVASQFLEALILGTLCMLGMVILRIPYAPMVGALIGVTALIPVAGAKINLPAIWVLAAVSVGGNLVGPLGMFLGVPAASTAYTLIREATNQRERKQSSFIPPDSCG